MPDRLNIGGIVVKRRASGRIVLTHSTGARQVIRPGDVQAIRQQATEAVVQARANRDETEAMLTAAEALDMTLDEAEDERPVVVERRNRIG